MISTIYHGSVKDLLGPVTAGKSGPEAVVFEYTDSYSVFDWGRMPDLLARKGEALAVLAADWFERLERPDTWKDFSRSHEALEIRKANRLGSIFNELGERLQQDGLRTHYLGVLTEQPQTLETAPRTLKDLNRPVRHLVARRVTSVRPAAASILGRTVPDYLRTRVSPPPRLIPLEVVFRFSCPPGSSLIERAQQDPNYLVTRGFSEATVQPGQKWAFPFLELFTKLETADRPLSLGEALAISGITGEQLQELLLKTAWVAALLKATCASAGLELADGKLEWGISDTGEIFLVDAIGPDELRILRNGTQLSKEFLRDFYRGSDWHVSVGRAKKQATAQGIADWKRLVAVGPSSLPAGHRELASQMYLCLANALSGRIWFPEAWNIDRVINGIQEMKKIGAGGG